MNPITEKSVVNNSRRQGEAAAVPGNDVVLIASSDKVSTGVAARIVNEEGEPLSLSSVADEIGGIPEEIRGWVESGEVSLVDAASALAGQICEEDFRRIERHQIRVDIRRCFKDPEKFLDTAFERFGDKTPRQLLARGDSDLVRDLVWQVKSGTNS